MDKIAEMLKAYIDAHPCDSGDSDCETVMDQLYQAYAESHESDPPEISNGFKELEEFSEAFPWRITTPYSTSVVASASPMNAKLLLTVFNMVHT